LGIYFWSDESLGIYIVKKPSMFILILFNLFVISNRNFFGNFQGKHLCDLKRWTLPLKPFDENCFSSSGNLFSEQIFLSTYQVKSQWFQFHISAFQLEISYMKNQFSINFWQNSRKKLDEFLNIIYDKTCMWVLEKLPWVKVVFWTYKRPLVATSASINTIPESIGLDMIKV
jgi:hypothetical protein